MIIIILYKIELAEKFEGQFTSLGENTEKNNLSSSNRKRR